MSLGDMHFKNESIRLMNSLPNKTSQKRTGSGASLSKL